MKTEGEKRTPTSSIAARGRGAPHGLLDNVRQQKSGRSFKRINRIDRHDRARIERANKKRCWIPSNSASVRALSASIVSSFSTCKFGASELRRRLNNPVSCDNLALSLVVHSSTQLAQRCIVCGRAAHRHGPIAARKLVTAGSSVVVRTSHLPRRSDGAAQREWSGRPAFTRAAAARVRRFRRRYRAGTSTRRR